MNISREEFRSPHSSRLERWLGANEVNRLSTMMRGWYGPPIHLLDTPGSVRVDGSGDFIGEIGRGRFSIGFDWALDRMHKHQQMRMMAGFTSISDALARASGGFGQMCNFNKVGSTGVVGATSSLWRLGPQPSVGSAPAAAPGGTAFTNASTGALDQADPASGTLHLVGADASANVAGNTLLLYDLLFGVNKTMASTATEAVTGVPTRYQSGTATAPDYIGGNFLFIQVGGTALPATAHNWTVCLYTDQASASSTLPSITGNSSAIVDRLDQPQQQWFAPLESGDAGVKALTQMQCSASVASGVIWFMIGHPLGFMSFPITNSVFPFDWLTNRNQAPRVFDGACLALLECMKPATGATTYTGTFHFTGAA